MAEEKLPYKGYDLRGDLVKCDTYPEGFSFAVQTEYQQFCEEPSEIENNSLPAESTPQAALWHFLSKMLQ